MHNQRKKRKEEEKGLTHLLAGEIKHVDRLVVAHCDHAITTINIPVHGGHGGEARAVDARAVGQSGHNGIVGSFEQLLRGVKGRSV